MQGEILVAAYMAAQERARTERKRFEDRQRLLAIQNALWAYHRAENKLAEAERFRTEFAWLNERKTAS